MKALNKSVFIVIGLPLFLAVSSISAFGQTCYGPVWTAGTTTGSCVCNSVRVLGTPVSMSYGSCTAGTTTTFGHNNCMDSQPSGCLDCNDMSWPNLGNFTPCTASYSVFWYNVSNFNMGECMSNNGGANCYMDACSWTTCTLGTPVAFPGNVYDPSSCQGACPE